MKINIVENKILHKKKKNYSRSPVANFLVSSFNFSFKNFHSIITYLTTCAGNYYIDARGRTLHYNSQWGVIWNEKTVESCTKNFTQVRPTSIFNTKIHEHNHILLLFSVSFHIHYISLYIRLISQFSFLLSSSLSDDSASLS